MKTTAAARGRSYSGILSGETRWRGEVQLAGDVVVPAGATLEIEAGARLSVAPSPSWKHPFERPGGGGTLHMPAAERCSLIVQGTLKVLGREAKPVNLAPDAPWVGVALLGDAKAEIAHAEIADADMAVACFDRSELRLLSCRLSGGGVGVLAAGFSRALLADSLFEKNERGLSACDFADLRAEGCRFHKNRLGASVEDGVSAELSACGFRANREAGLQARGRARLRAAKNAFEGHPREAAILIERASVSASENRFFGNGQGYSLRDDSALTCAGDIIGPSRLCGVQAAQRSRAELRNAFLHSHDAEPAAQCLDDARLGFSGCRFFSNGIGLSAFGRARWRVEDSTFKGNGRAALDAGEDSAGEVFRGEFLDNGAAAVFHGRARAEVRDSRFAGSAGPGLRAQDRSRVSARRCRFEGNEVGLEAQDGAELDLRENEVLSQSLHGVLARQSARVRARRSRFADNRLTGVQALDGASVRLEGNEFTANAVGAGFRERASGFLGKNAFHAQSGEGVCAASEGDVLIQKNLFSRNRVGVGHFAADRSVVRGNRFLGQRDAAGVCADHAAPLWEGNRCLDNARALECRDQARPVVKDNRFMEGPA